MILSMTGYGKAEITFRNHKLICEIRSLNSKSMDLSVRLASCLRAKELDIRTIVNQRLERGKVDFSIWVEKDAGSDATPINGAIVENYYQQLRRIVDQVGIPEPQDWLQTLMRLPDVTTRTEMEELDEEEWKAARQAIEESLAQLEAFRRQEGAALQRKFTEKIDNIASLLAQIEPYEKSRVEKIRQRIVDGLKEIPEVDYDKNRLEQELIYYIEKLDISEEKQRLANHLKYFRETMQEEGRGIGKKLGFIAQEMGREINTTGSKSNQAEMQNLVVMMKDELEQIKEQVLNAL